MFNEIGIEIVMYINDSDLGGYFFSLTTRTYIMVIRYMTSEGTYFSLNDVADLLREEGVLTKKQQQLYKTQCQAYMSRELAKAYRDKQVMDYMQPVILPFSDYFIHCEAWESLFALLPKAAMQQRKVDYIGYMLSEPDSVHRYPDTFNAVDLFCMTRRAKLRVMSLPGPLVLEKRDN